MRYESHRFHDAYLQIQIKDRGFLGNGLFLGEAFLPLNELRLGDLDQRLSDLPQIQLPLSKPSGFGEKTFFNWKEILDIFKTYFFPKDSDVMLALDSRHFDQVAKQFLQKEKRKLWKKLLMLLTKNFSYFIKILFFCDQYWISLIKAKKQRKNVPNPLKKNSLFVFKENYYIMYYKHAEEQYVKTKELKKSYSPLSRNNFSNSSSALVKSSSVLSAAPPVVATLLGSSLSVKVFKSTVRP